MKRLMALACILVASGIASAGGFGGGGGKVSTRVQSPQSATGQYIELLEATGNGTNKVKIFVPDALPGDVLIDASQLTVAPDSLPAQTGNSGKYLTTNGSASSWANPFDNFSGSGIPTVPTAATGTNTTQAANMLAVNAAIADHWQGVLSSDPATFSNGQFWYNTARNKFTFVENGAKVTYSATQITEAVLGITPSSYSYGSVSSGSTADHTFTVNNSGSGTATGLALSGGGVFSVYSSTCDTTLAASSSCEAVARFSPVAAESYSGTLTASATGVTSAVSSLSGTGTSAWNTRFTDNFTRADNANIVTGSSWDTETDTSGISAITSNAMTITQSASSANINKNLGTSYGEWRYTFDVKVSQITGYSATNYVSLLQIRNGSDAGVAFVAVRASGTSLNQVFTSHYTESSPATPVNTFAAFTYAPNTTYTFIVSGKAASSTGVSDGTLTVTVNGTQVVNLTGLANYGRNMQKIQYGMPTSTGTPPGTVWTHDNVVVETK